MKFNQKLGVLLWLYHTELDTEFYRLLHSVSDQADIYLSLCSENNNKSTEKLFNTLSNIKSINYYPNIGADLYSFINDLDLVDNKYFIKLHSKKSYWGYNYRCNWRSMLVDSLIADRTTLSNNIQYISENNLGSIGCGSLIYQKTESIHKDKIRQILQLCNMNSNSQYRFVGGTMFMGETSLYQQHLMPHKQQLSDLLKQERGKVDENRSGTYSHAMERVLGYIGCLKGLESSKIDYIKIKLPNDNIMNFRIMYNKDIYCIQEPKIYGKVMNITDNNFTVNWKNDIKEIVSCYKRIDHNLYVNELYLHGGV